MLVFSDQNLVFLAVPKTGTTAIEMALKPRADIIFTKGRKHTTAMRYHNKIAPFLEDTFGVAPETVALMRDPLEQIRSWYRYRSRPEKIGTRRGTKGISFDQFVLGIITHSIAPEAGVGSQLRFLTNAKDEVLVTHLFAYEKQPAFRQFLSEKFQENISFKLKNVSPHIATPLSAEVEAQLRASRAAEFALYEKLMAASGYLKF